MVDTLPLSSTFLCSLLELPHGQHSSLFQPLPPSNLCSSSNVLHGCLKFNGLTLLSSFFFCDCLSVDELSLPLCYRTSVCRHLLLFLISLDSSSFAPSYLTFQCLPTSLAIKALQQPHSPWHSPLLWLIGGCCNKCPLQYNPVPTTVVLTPACLLSPTPKCNSTSHHGSKVGMSTHSLSSVMVGLPLCFLSTHLLISLPTTWRPKSEMTPNQPSNGLIVLDSCSSTYSSRISELPMPNMQSSFSLLGGCLSPFGLLLVHCRPSSISLLFFLRSAPLGPGSSPLSLHIVRCLHVPSLCQCLPSCLCLRAASFAPPPDYCQCRPCFLKMTYQSSLSLPLHWLCQNGWGCTCITKILLCCLLEVASIRSIAFYEPLSSYNILLSTIRVNQYDAVSSESDQEKFVTASPKNIRRNPFSKSISTMKGVPPPPTQLYVDMLFGIMVCDETSDPTNHPALFVNLIEILRIQNEEQTKKQFFQTLHATTLPYPFAIFKALRGIRQGQHESVKDFDEHIQVFVSKMDKSICEDMDYHYLRPPVYAPDPEKTAFQARVENLQAVMVKSTMQLQQLPVCQDVWCPQPCNTMGHTHNEHPNGFGILAIKGVVLKEGSRAICIIRRLSERRKVYPIEKSCGHIIC
eukprot:Gb_05686 [translate_table: standard]